MHKIWMNVYYIKLLNLLGIIIISSLALLLYIHKFLLVHLCLTTGYHDKGLVIFLSSTMKMLATVHYSNS